MLQPLKNVLFPSILALLMLTGAAFAQQVWFVPPDNLPRGGHVRATDFADLIEKPDAWRQTLARVDVFGMNPRYPIAAPDDELRRLFAFLKQHRIALAAGMAMVTGHGCGFNVEGMTREGSPAAIARRIKRLGGELRYVSMDEPLMFGHDYDRQNACRYSIEDIARFVAESVREIRAVFPDVRIVDAEPIGHLSESDWLGEFTAWLDAYRHAVGEPLFAVQDDPSWNGPWRQRMPKVRSLLQSRGIGFGIMFIAGAPGNSDAAWIEAAKRHIGEFRSEFRSQPPQQVIFTSWNVYPSRLLPDSDPLTLTGLMASYFGTVR